MKFSANVIQQHIEDGINKQKKYSHIEHLGLSRASVLQIVTEFYEDGDQCPDQYFDNSGNELDEYLSDAMEAELLSEQKD